jgi:hypothetical protein
MAKYKNIIVGYINDSKNSEGQYLSLKNVSDEDIVIPAGEKLFLSKTPAYVLEKNPKVPAFSKSVKVEEEVSADEAREVFGGDESDDIPF